MDEQYSLVKRVKMKSFIPRETDARIQEEEIQELVFLTRWGTSSTFLQAVPL